MVVVVVAHRVAVAVISWAEIGCLAFVFGECWLVVLRRLFSDEFPFFVFVGRDFTNLQKIPEGIIGVKTGIGIGLGGGGSGGGFGDGREGFRIQEIFGTEVIAAFVNWRNWVFATTVTSIATDAENIEVLCVIRIGHFDDLMRFDAI